MNFIFFYIIYFTFFCNSLKLNNTKLANVIISSSLLFDNPLFPILAPSPVAATTLEKTYVTTENNIIYFYGGLNTDSARALKDTLQSAIGNGIYFEKSFPETNAPPIKLHIQSYGGSLMDTLYIIDLIKTSPIPIYTYVDGYVASAATLISVVGNKRFITENSLMLIHQLSTVSGGKFNELEDETTNNRLMMNIIKSIYYKYTKISPSELEEILKHDLWFDANKCKRLGLVDEIID